MIFSVVEEELVVEKRLKLVEEIRVTPAETESQDNVKVKLRKERLVIRRDGEPLKDKNKINKTKFKSMTQTVVGIFGDPNAAENAVSRLTAYGFSESEIDVSNRDNFQGGGMSRDTEHSDEGFGERVSRFFRNLFDDERDAEQYSTLAREGTVVSVYASSREEAERAADILDEYGALNVNESMRTEYQASSTEGADISPSRDESSDRSIPVIEEDLHVGKREVETGGMRVRSRIIERPVEESLRLRTEHVRVDRTPADRPATDADMNAFREGEVEIRERSEEPVVNKQARVVEEINVRKDVEEHDEVVRDTVRKSDVEVERLGKEEPPKGNKSKKKT